MPFDLEERFVERTEAELGARFPASYRPAMMKSNGGTYEKDGRVWFFYPIRDTSDRKRSARTAIDVVAETKTSGSYGHFPSGAVAIASDDEGNQLVLLRSEHRLDDALYFWDHDTGDVTRVADDFAEMRLVAIRADRQS